MKNIKLFYSVMIICLLAFSGGAQTLAPFIAKEKSEAKTEAASLMIHLKPGEKRAAVEVSDSCMILITDFHMSINIPFSKTFETVLPAGTKIPLPRGSYPLENLTPKPVAFEIYDGIGCTNIRN